MGPPLLTRRRFAALLASGSLGLSAQTSGPALAHASVAILDLARILADANAALSTPLPTAPAITQPAIQRHCNALATLTSAFLATHDDSWLPQTGKLLQALFVTPSTRLNPQPEIANPTPSAAPPPPGTLHISDLAPLGETARALSFLIDVVAPDIMEPTQSWFATFLDWLTTARNPVLARDTKDHNASAWLLLASAVSRALGPAGPNAKILDDCRHRFRKPTLRNQINLDGAFPHEVASETPFRSSLLNFDLLAGCAQLLSTPFDDLWPYELEDGTGLRAAAAFLYPAMQQRHNWPYVADPQFFRDLPSRRPALLFAGRAYNRPEYVQTWLDTPAPDLGQLPQPVAASFPIREPLLFTARAPHGR